LFHVLLTLTTWPIPAYNRLHYALATFIAFFETPAIGRSGERWMLQAREEMQKSPRVREGSFVSWLRMLDSNQRPAD
jgi:hypothetical protein